MSCKMNSDVSHAIAIEIGSSCNFYVSQGSVEIYLR